MAGNIIIIGPFPPPVHGMSKNLLALHDDLNPNVDCIKLNTSPGTLVRGLRYHGMKFLRVVYSFFKLIFLSLVRDIKCVYLPPDAGVGTWYSLLFVLVCKVFNHKIFMHHRSFAYIHKAHLPMRILTSVSSNIATHIFLCNCMADKFIQRYKGCDNHCVVSNAMHIKEFYPKVRDFDRKVHLGFLSNVSFDKGIDVAIEIAKNVFDTEVDIDFTIAGPFEDEAVESFVTDKIAENSFIKYLGPVYGEDKFKFYSNIDFFVFPTQYRNEAQPNVLFEAMAYGVPIISLDIACIRSDIPESCGFIGQLNQNFVSHAANFITQNFPGTEKYTEISDNCIKFIESSSANSLISYKELLSRLSNA
jgi:glycosyltransferase involved in cell wall biosynthesis